MDLNTLTKAGNSSLLKPHFKGILFSDSSSTRKIPNGSMGDFYFINTNHFKGEHWFTLIRAVDMWLLCDSSGFTPHLVYKHITSRLSLPFTIDRKELQQSTSLLCGEFALMAAILMIKLLNTSIKKLTYSTYPCNFYSSNILKYSKIKKCTPDKFVYGYIYSSMKHELHIKPEQKGDVLAWLCQQ